VDEAGDTGTDHGSGGDNGEDTRRKYYVDGGQVEIAAHVVYEIDSEGNQLRVVKYTDYTAEKVRTLYPNAHELRKRWADPANRNEIIEALAERGVDFEQLADVSGQPDADPFDLLCHLAFNAPLRTRRERAQRLRTGNRAAVERPAPMTLLLARTLAPASSRSPLAR
jgi:type I restriction enzyme R subunit